MNAEFIYFLQESSNSVSAYKEIYMVAERAQRAVNKKNTCKLRNDFLNLTTHNFANAHNTTKKRNALQIKCFWLCCEHLQCVSLFVCVVSIFTICCQTDENVFLICWCFFYLHVFSEVAARWALSATVGIILHKSQECNRRVHI